MAAPAAAQVTFDRVTIAPLAGDVKLVGDLNGDGLPDLVLGGDPAEGLNWFEAPAWTRRLIATPEVEFTTDGRLADINGDGRLDIVVPDGPVGANLKVFLNVRRGPFQPPSWERRDIGSIGGWGKDVYTADFDGDGRVDVATRRSSEAMIFFQGAGWAWTRVALAGLPLGDEGMFAADIDGDGWTDLIVRGAWARNPGGAAARTAANWAAYTIGEADSAFRALAADINGDGVTDVLYSSSENTADVRWWTPATGDPRGPWVSRLIAPAVERAHTLQAADMNLDGRVDVIVGQMHTSAARELAVYYNVAGNGLTWQRQVVDTVGTHLAVVADLEADGDMDIYGANWTGNPPAYAWLNRLRCPGPRITAWPTSQTIVEGETAEMAVGVEGATEFRWRRDGADLTDGASAGGGLIVGAGTARLEVRNAGRSDAGTYTLRASTECGETLVAAGLAVFCATDLDRSGGAEPADLALFVGAWIRAVEDGSNGGDVDRDGSTAPSDVAWFVNAWFASVAAGC